MTKPLAPAVESPISVLNTDVTVTGVRLGAEVIVHGNGAEIGRENSSAGGGIVGPTGITAVTVPLKTSLTAGEQVSAQQLDGELSDPSPSPVTVVGLPPAIPAPVLVTFPFAGVEVVLVRNCFPGAKLEVSLSGGGAPATMSAVVVTWDMVVRLPRPVAAGDRITLTLRAGGSTAKFDDAGCRWLLRWKHGGTASNASLPIAAKGVR